jgi:hypothetical protein
MVSLQAVHFFILLIAFLACHFDALLLQQGFMGKSYNNNSCDRDIHFAETRSVNSACGYCGWPDVGILFPRQRLNCVSKAMLFPYYYPLSSLISGHFKKEDFPRI